MFRNWFQQESNNEVFLVLFIVFLVLGAFVSLVIWIVRLARQNKKVSAPVNFDADEITEDNMGTIKQLETYKHMLLNSVHESDHDLAHAIQCLDYYYLNKWIAQLREACEGAISDVTVQKVLKEMEDYMDLYNIDLETKQNLYELAQLNDAIVIHDNPQRYSFSN